MRLIWLSWTGTASSPRAGVFYVTGQVKKPAAYKLEKGTSVIKAITFMAGGFTELAAQRKIQIIRNADEQELVLKGTAAHTCSGLMM
ncbi:MAG: SLBB domain-containing protein [Syntrophotaleaceae bacterium]